MVLNKCNGRPTCIPKKSTTASPTCWRPSAATWPNSHEWVARVVVLAFAALAGGQRGRLHDAVRPGLGAVQRLARPALALAAVGRNAAAVRRDRLVHGAVLPRRGRFRHPAGHGRAARSRAAAARGRFVSLRLALAKIALTAGGPAGRARHRPRRAVGADRRRRDAARAALAAAQGAASIRTALLVAGGAAGIAAAFNAPLAGIMFAHRGADAHASSRAAAAW